MRQAKVTENARIKRERNAKIRRDYDAEMSIEGAMPSAVAAAVAKKYNLNTTTIYRILKNS